MEVDVCIVGSGAGGAPIAYVLQQAGFDVVVVEKGPYIKREDFSKDEIALRRGIYRSNIDEEFHVIYQNGKRYVGKECGWSFNNGSLVGGATNFMSGYFHKMQPIDFRLKTEFGALEGANIEDWPIAYEDLKPYYDKVAHVVGVSGEGLPYPPLKENIAAQWFDEACRKLEICPVKTPRAILSLPKGDRNSCVYSGFCGSYGCSSGAKSSSREAMLQDVKILDNSFAYKLDSDAKRVHTLYYFDQKRKSHKIHASIFVLALSPIETVRLLFNSKNRYFPDGLANSSSHLGKNLIFSAGGVGGGVMKKEMMHEDLFTELQNRALFLNRNLKEWYVYEKGNRRQKGGVIDFLFEHSNIIMQAQNRMWNGNKPLWGAQLAKRLEKINNERVIQFEVFNDWLPTDRCQIGIEPGLKDRWGINVAAIYLDAHPRNREVANFLGKKGIEVLKKMGATSLYYFLSDDPPTNLVAGGCRFGNDPRHSVLDPTCRSWDLENLYISDASFMPTGGSIPYTWTIYANAFRVAENVKKQLRKSIN